MKSNNVFRRIVLSCSAGVLLGSVASLSAQTLTNGLIFYAPFSGTLNDVAGARPGVGYNGPTLQATGGVGGGGYVQLQNDSVNLEQAVYYSDPTPAQGNFTFQAWVRTADMGYAQNGQSEPDMAIAANKDWAAGGNVGWVLARQSGANGDKFQWNMNTQGNSRKDFDLLTPSATVFDGSWHQIVVTYDRTGNATFYRDGTQIGTVNISANTGSMRPVLDATWVKTNIMVLGQDATLRYWHETDPNISSLNGDLDEVAMWDRVLTAEEVAAAYAKGNAGVAVTSALTPSFAEQPKGGTRYASDNLRLSCMPIDDRGPLTYQWYNGSTPISGATNRVVLVTNLTAGATSYHVVVNDGVGSITSANAAVTVLSSSNITNGIAAYLNFDNNIDGQIGTPYNGTTIGYDPTPKYTNGIVGTAAMFNNDGSVSGIPTDWAISLGDLESVYSNNWTFSTWINLTNNLDGALLGNKDWTSGGNVGWVLSAYNNRSANFNAAGGPRRDIGTMNVRDGKWHHMVLQFNRDANLATLYIDGNAHATAGIGSTGWESLTPDNVVPNATLVGSSGSGIYSGAGSVDDLGIWGRMLTADEILAIYAQGTEGKPLTQAIAGAAVKPSISAQPQPVTVFEGQRVRLSVTAAGTTPLGYQWYRSGTAVTGGTTNVLNFAAITAAEQGSYTVVITNKFGAVTSAPPAAVTVMPVANAKAGLVVYLNLDDTLNASGGTTNAGTAIYGDYTPKYTPGKIGTAAAFNNDGSAGTSSDWSISLGNIEWLYAGSWSFSMWINVTNANDGALIGNKDWNSGDNVGWVFSPTRTGNGLTGKGCLNYTTAGGPRLDPGGASLVTGTWRHVAATFDRDNNRMRFYVDGALVVSTNLSTLGTESLTPGNIVNDTLIGGSGPGTWSGQGWVDDVGLWVRPISADEVLSVYVQGINGQPLTTASAGAIAPLITGKPQNVTRAEGFPASFTGAAAGTAPMSYQWFRNGTEIPGATDATYTVIASMADSGAGFTFRATNLYGSAVSSPAAVLTVTPKPSAITSDLVVYLNFDSNIVAQAGTAISGTAIGTVGVATYTNGMIGAAASFNNNNSDNPEVSDWAVSLGDIEWIYTNSFSFSLWIKTTDDYGAFLGNKNWYSGNNIGWSVSEYLVDFLNYRATGASRHDIGGFNWADGQWHQVSAVFYRQANQVYTFVDGQQTAVASLGLTGMESLTPEDIRTTLVGSSGNMTESAYGVVDDLAIWTRPVSASEMAAIYQSGLIGKPVPQASNVAPPKIEAGVSGSNFMVSFPESAGSFTLQSSPTMTSGSWTTVTGTRTTVNGRTTVTVPMGTTPAFFRLVR